MHMAPDSVYVAVGINNNNKNAIVRKMWWKENKQK